MTYDTSQIQAAYARSGLTMQDLARKAGLSASTAISPPTRANIIQKSHTEFRWSFAAFQKAGVTLRQAHCF